MSETLLSPTHRPGTLHVRSNPNTESDCDYFTCPGCGTELYSSYVHAWAGIDCESCGCTFSAIDEATHLWDFDVLPTIAQEPTMRLCPHCGQHHYVKDGEFYCPLDPNKA